MKKFFIIACVFGLVNYSTEDCSASNRRKKNASNVCQLENDFNLRNLDDLYTYYQGMPQYWDSALYAIDKKVVRLLDVRMSKFSNNDKKAMWAFMTNQSSMINFVRSEYYNENIHARRIVNLFMLSRKIVDTFVRSNDDDMNKYRSFVGQLNLNLGSLRDVLCMDKYSLLISSIACKLDDAINWD